MQKLETLETLETSGGNTKTPLVNRIVPGKYWCFTYNNYKLETLETMETQFRSLNIKYIIGKEVGENGTPHLQGYIECDKKIRPIEYLKLDKNIHWEKAKGDKQSNIKYCSKDEDYITNMNEDIIEDLFIGKIPYDYQKFILNLIKQKPDSRTIHWFYDHIGNTGKTSFSKHICLKHRDDAIYISGKSSDIKCAIASCKKKPRICIFDFVRSSEEFISYEAIEAVKNGIFFSGKYESETVIMNCPHVIIFANFEPEKSKLSLDRWKIIEATRNITDPKITEYFNVE